jgi:hypothetical protein
MMVRFLTVIGLIAAAVVPVHAAELVQNGGFETGFTGWTRVDQLGSDGSFALQTGTLSPVNGFPVPPPPGGTKAAMTDAEGPGSHVLFQSFTVSSPTPTMTLSFDVFVGNRAAVFFTPNTLDFSTPTLDQQARVDITLGSADPFSLSATDVLLNAFKTNVGDPLVSGYTHVVVDVTSLVNANLGVPLRLRFAEVDNVFAFNFGVDNVSLSTGTAAVPEPGSWMLTLAGAIALAWRVRQRVAARRRVRDV